MCTLPRARTCARRVVAEAYNGPAVHGADDARTTGFSITLAAAVTVSVIGSAEDVGAVPCRGNPHNRFVEGADPIEVSLFGNDRNRDRAIDRARFLPASCRTRHQASLCPAADVHAIRCPADELDVMAGTCVPTESEQALAGYPGSNAGSATSRDGSFSLDDRGRIRYRYSASSRAGFKDVLLDARLYHRQFSGTELAALPSRPEVSVRRSRRSRGCASAQSRRRPDRRARRRPRRV
jgi:hypothetical protein